MRQRCLLLPILVGLVLLLLPKFLLSPDPRHLHKCIKKPIVWIAGGVDKGNDYSSLMPLVREKVKAIVCLGMDNTKLKEQLQLETKVCTKESSGDSSGFKCFLNHVLLHIVFDL